MIRALLFIVISFFLPSSLLGESLARIKLVYVQTDGGLTPAEFNLFVADLRHYLQANISKSIRITQSTQQISPPKSLSSDSTILNRTAIQLTHYVFGPTNTYVYGWANRCSKSPHHNSYSTAKLSRYYESLTAAAHEIAHQLGAKHRTGLMDADALAYASDHIPLPISKTLTDIYQCGNFIKAPTNARKPSKGR